MLIASGLHPAAPLADGSTSVPMPPYLPKPKYVWPTQAAAAKSRRRALLYWTAVCLPLAFALIAFGYSDQAPEWLRALVTGLDRTLGYPILRIIGVIATR